MQGLTFAPPLPGLALPLQSSCLLLAFVLRRPHLPWDPALASLSHGGEACHLVENHGTTWVAVNIGGFQNGGLQNQWFPYYIWPILEMVLQTLSVMCHSSTCAQGPLRDAHNVRSFGADWQLSDPIPLTMTPLNVTQKYRSPVFYWIAGFSGRGYHVLLIRRPAFQKDLLQSPGKQHQAAQE